ncbi:hypothetical protein DEI91_04620 [Curtobacterium sp. MCBD17_032]|nr:hypothetical protein DEI91_04620 [Curtobacterium sp. MCBD17_032]
MVATPTSTPADVSALPRGERVLGPTADLRRRGADQRTQGDGGCSPRRDRGGAPPAPDPVAVPLRDGRPVAQCHPRRGRRDHGLPPRTARARRDGVPRVGCRVHHRLLDCEPRERRDRPVRGGIPRIDGERTATGSPRRR